MEILGIIVTLGLAIWAVIHTSRERTNSCVFQAILKAQDNALTALKIHDFHEAEIQLKNAEHLVRLLPEVKAQLVRPNLVTIRRLVEWERAGVQAAQ